MAISTKSDAQWQAESDVRTLQDAEEIKSNKARMKRAETQARKQQKNLQKIAKTTKPTGRARKR
jgi:hypothetical protein